METKQRTKRVYSILRKTYPDAHCELLYRNPLELLVATMLSAQCTDLKVNEVTRELFREYKKPEDYLAKPVSHLENLIRPTGFYRNKAKNIRNAMQAIVDRHKGKMPKTMEELTALPGVGRKTANVVLGNAFGLPGLPVDTHVMRVTNRIGITKEADPVKIEYELHELLPEKEWCMFSHTMIFHGRRICKAKKPACEICPVLELCKYGQRREYVE